MLARAAKREAYNDDSYRLMRQECTRDCGSLLVRGMDHASPDGQRLVKAAKALHKVRRPVACPDYRRWGIPFAR